MCNCYEQANEALKLYNTRLTPMVSWNQQTGAMRVDVKIATEKIDSRNRRGPAELSASYCPFCGGKIEQETGIDTQRAGDDPQPSSTTMPSVP